MVTSLRPSPTPQVEVFSPCAHCGGRLFLEEDIYDSRFPYFLNCINCARHVSLSRISVRQLAMVVTPPRRIPERPYRNLRRNRGILVGAH